MRRLEFLDALRGLAAIYVVIFHTAVIPNPALKIPEWASAFVLNGWSGVTLFFIVSGFSLCHAMNRDPEVGAGAFYLRRFFRIAPLFYVMLAVSLALDWQDYGARHATTDVALNGAFLFNLLPGHEAGIVWASWTIGVEMLFYAVFPLLFAWFKGIRGTALLLAGTVAVALLSQPGHFSVLGHLPVFALGMVAYYVYGWLTNGHPVPRLLGPALIMAGAAGWLALVCVAPDISPTSFYYTQAVAYAALLIGLGLCPLRIIVNRWTAYAGTISYSMYLLHPRIVFHLAPIYRYIGASGLSAGIALAMDACLTLCIVAAAASLTYRLIERPAMEWLRRPARQSAEATSLIYG